jgi:Glycosyltransferase (GlcNAc)
MSTKNNTIFVQIASYRDPELRSTLKSLLENAKYPENLKIAIAWQHSPYEEWDTLDEYKNDPRFSIIDIDYRDAKGPCSARYLLNKIYLDTKKNKPKYTLQLDSHHRFAENWDVELIAMLESLKTPTCKKPMLTAYVPSYLPESDPDSRIEIPWIVEFDRFAPDGNVHFLPHSIDDWKERNSPVPTRFASGHFIFTYATFCKDVTYDPTYYFHGEEINLSVRSFMAGYDMFSPHRTFVWHEYTRNNKKKHWDDHSDWVALERKSHEHNRALLGVDDITDKVLKKNVRSLSEYEMYAGIEFLTRKVHTNTINKQIPPISLTLIDHERGLKNYRRVCIDAYRPLFSESDYDNWAVALEDEDGVEIYRQDANPHEIQQLLSIPEEVDKFIHVWRSFYSDKLPVSWVIWPHSKTNGWCERITGKLSIT